MIRYIGSKCSLEVSYFGITSYLCYLQIADEKHYDLFFALPHTSNIVWIPHFEPRRLAAQAPSETKAGAVAGQEAQRGSGALIEMV